MQLDSSVTSRGTPEGTPERIPEGMERFMGWILSDGIHIYGHLLCASTSAKVRNVCEYADTSGKKIDSSL